MAPESESGAEQTSNADGGAIPFQVALKACAARLGAFYSETFVPTADAIRANVPSSELRRAQQLPQQQQAMTARERGFEQLPFKLLRRQSRRSVLTPRDLNIEYGADTEQPRKAGDSPEEYPRMTAAPSPSQPEQGLPGQRVQDWTEPRQSMKASNSGSASRGPGSSGSVRAAPIAAAAASAAKRRRMSGMR